MTHLTCSSSQALQALFQPLQRGQSIKVKEIMTEEVTPVTPSPSPPPTSHLHNPIFLSSPLLTPPSLSPPSTHYTLSSPSHIHPTLPTLPTPPYSSPHSPLLPHIPYSPHFSHIHPTLSPPSTHCTLSSPSHVHPTLPTTPYSSPHSSLPPHALTLSSPSTHTHTPLPPHTLTPFSLFYTCF